MVLNHRLSRMMHIFWEGMVTFLALKGSYSMEYLDSRNLRSISKPHFVCTCLLSLIASERGTVLCMDAIPKDICHSPAKGIYITSVVRLWFC